MRNTPSWWERMVEEEPRDCNFLLCVELVTEAERSLLRVEG